MSGQIKLNKHGRNLLAITAHKIKRHLARNAKETPLVFMHSSFAPNIFGLKDCLVLTKTDDANKVSLRKEGQAVSVYPAHFHFAARQKGFYPRDTLQLHFKFCSIEWRKEHKPPFISQIEKYVCNHDKNYCSRAQQEISYSTGMNGNEFTQVKTYGGVVRAKEFLKKEAIRPFVFARKYLVRK